MRACVFARHIPTPQHAIEKPPKGGFLISIYTLRMSMVTLSKPLESISFVERESFLGRKVSFKCGRDFLYYALNFYFPEKFNAQEINPLRIDQEKLFGIPVPKRLAWTQVQFLRMPEFLKKNGFTLFINNRHISSYVGFVCGNLFSRISYVNAMKQIENCVQNDVACAIDIPVSKKFLTLLDHVMFVYGYDDEYLYVLDTLTVPYVAYERLRDDIHYYRLSRKVIEANWSLFGRVWRVEKVR
jgi:hypothetical protein